MLAIDEISMLNIRAFEYVDKVLRLVREVDKPFGGIQVIFLGDFSSFLRLKWEKVQN